MSTLPQTGVYAGKPAFKVDDYADANGYETRKSLPPISLGTLRRRRKGATSAAALRGAGAKRPSLDTSNQLETSLLFWLQTPETPKDSYTYKRKMQDVLEISCGKICADIERQLEETYSRPVSNVRCSHKDKATKKQCQGMALEGSKLCLTHELEVIRAELKTWARTWARLSDCQSEWIGYVATCCTSALAIPIGCNHRGCFLCNSRRLKKYQDRVKTLFDRLENPVLLTLTVPNTAKLSKRTFSTLRRGWNQFRKGQPWLEGGIYALETTYRKSAQPETPWHTHLHTLAGAAAPLPQCKCGRCNRCGKWTDRKSVCRCGGHTGWRWHRYDDSGKWVTDHASDCAFIRFFRRLEFDWFLSTGGRSMRWSNASFNQWLSRTQPGNWRSESDRKQWDSRNRRVIYIQRVTDREKACREIIKYVTKTADFAHEHEAVKEFFTASRGARMLQTYGSWYGLKLDPDVNKGMPSEKNSWNGLACDCGKNDFYRFGKVGFLAVKMREDGQWRMRPEVYERGSPPEERDANRFSKTPDTREQGGGANGDTDSGQFNGTEQDQGRLIF